MKLARQTMHSEKLAYYLQEKEIEPSVIQEVLLSLKEQGFLDDKAFVEYFIEKWQRKGKSALQIRQKAKEHKIPLQELNSALFDEKKAVKTLIDKRYQVLVDNRADREKKMKAMRSLSMKGFSHTVINEVIREYD